MKNNIKKRLSYIIIAFLIIGISVISFLFYNISSKYTFVQDNVDRIFGGNFSALCNNLNISEDAQKDEYYFKENIKHSNICASLFTSTSFCENNIPLNDIVIKLSELCENNTLYNFTDNELREKLNYLSAHITDKTAAKEVWEKMKTLE